MSNVAEIWKLAAELRDYLDVLWDKQFEEDVKAGRLDGLIARARDEHAAGKTQSTALPIARFFKHQQVLASAE